MVDLPLFEHELDTVYCGAGSFICLYWEKKKSWKEDLEKNNCRLNRNSEINIWLFFIIIPKIMLWTFRRICAGSCCRLNLETCVIHRRNSWSLPVPKRSLTSPPSDTQLSQPLKCRMSFFIIFQHHPAPYLSGAFRRGFTHSKQPFDFAAAKD